MTGEQPYHRLTVTVEDVAKGEVVSFIGVLRDGVHYTLRKGLPPSRPRDAEDALGWLYERAEEAAATGLPLERALQAVRDGYSSIEADRMIAEEGDADDA